jgi:ATP diphosphatase
MMSRLPELLSIMRRLRAQDGCPWDRQQTFASIAPYTVEEAYEVADAIDRGALADLRDELGDLLFQVVFHAEMASEQGAFDFEAVVASICGKLIRRHPHVFGERGRLTADEQGTVWEDIKAQERGGDSALHGVPQSLPALMRAYKLSKRAARVGFDFEHPSQTADKVAEELAEVREAAKNHTAAENRGAAGNHAAAGNQAAAPSQETFEEVGDLLFAAANLARKLGVDAESALRAANLKFERRFRAMEQLAKARGQVFSGLNLAAQESLWLDVKRAE